MRGAARRTSLKSISSSGHQGLPSAASHWSPAILVHLLTHCHLPVPRRLLEASEFCPEVAEQAPASHQLAFKLSCCNTELKHCAHCGDKTEKADRVPPHGAYVPVGNEASPQNMQIATVPALFVCT